MKFQPLPPGEYTVQIERTRKVRNKPQRRIHYKIVEGEHAGRQLTGTISER